jgi:hypothetical protein
MVDVKGVIGHSDPVPGRCAFDYEQNAVVTVCASLVLRISDDGSIECTNIHGASLVAIAIAGTHRVVCDNEPSHGSRICILGADWAMRDAVPTAHKIRAIAIDSFGWMATASDGKLAIVCLDRDNRRVWSDYALSQADQIVALCAAYQHALCANAKEVAVLKSGDRRVVHVPIDGKVTALAVKTSNGASGTFNRFFVGVETGYVLIFEIQCQIVKLGQVGRKDPSCISITPKPNIIAVGGGDGCVEFIGLTE